MNKTLELVGQQYGQLIVIAKAGKNKWNHPLYWCLCSCGEYIIIMGSDLARKQRSTKSCGCLKRKLAGKQRLIHGQSDTKIYWVWANMRARCFYDKHIDFKNYGGRGITVCKRWFKFENFIADMGKRPSNKHAIERISNDGNYEPKNCIWVLQAINNRNKRKYKNNTTGCNGVYWNKINKTYMVQINKIYLGCFKKLSDAIIARKDGELKYWGKVSNA